MENHDETTRPMPTSEPTGETATADEAVATEPAALQPARPTRTSHPVRTSTLVWGIVVLAVGAGVLAWAGGYRFDVQLAAIGLLGVAGLALVVGSAIRSVQRRDR